MAERRQGRWLRPGWWLLAGGLAVALKAHFSAAAASELAWMLRPLALLVQLASGWRFTPNASGEWQSLGAGIVLVKACAGINFMILSFLGWCWMLRPRGVREMSEVREVRDAGDACITRGDRSARSDTATPAWALPLEWSLMLLGALSLAWAMALAVNALRILAVVRWQPALERWLAHEEAHRMVGLLVYLPALSLQMVLAECRRWRSALLAGCMLYAALMLVVPLVTGNALANPRGYGAHAVRVLAALTPILLLALWRRPDRSLLVRAAGGGQQSSGGPNCTRVLALYRGGSTPCHHASQHPPCLPLPPDAPSCSRLSLPAPQPHCHRSHGRPPAQAPMR